MAKKTTKKTDVATAAPSAADAPASQDAPVERIAGKLPPFADDELHPQVLEALKNLEVACAAYQRAVDNLEGQFLKSIDHGETAQQVAAVRALF